MSKAPQLSALFVNYNSVHYLERALHSLWAQRVAGKPLLAEVIVVDNASPGLAAERDRLEQLRDRYGVRLVYNAVNSGYSGGMNRALREASAPVILVSNPDVLYREGCIEKLLRVLEDRSVGITGPCGYLDESAQLILPVHFLPTLEDEVARFRGRYSRRLSLEYSIPRARESHRLNRATTPVDVGMLSGACLAMRRDAVDAFGFFDERFPLYYEDSDLCRRVPLAGMRLVYVPDAAITHYVSRSVVTAPAHDDPKARWVVARSRYFKKWYGRLGQALADRVEVETPRRYRRAGKASPSVDLGVLKAAPTFRFPPGAPEILIEISLDAAFFLSASAYASGAEWKFPESAWKTFFTGIPIFIRAIDVRDFSVLGAWTFRAPAE